MTTATATYTPDDLLTLPDAVGYELVDGDLVQRHMGSESSEIAAKNIFLIHLYLREHQLGRLFGSDTSYRCSPPRRIRCGGPMSGSSSSSAFPTAAPPKGHCMAAPDLAVEVVSPNDTSEELDEKVLEWLAAGVPLVWVVSPGTRTVRVHRPRNAAAGQVSLLSEEDAISGEDVLPGFSAPVRAFFVNG